jgi:hypothetical protein
MAASAQGISAPGTATAPRVSIITGLFGVATLPGYGDPNVDTNQNFAPQGATPGSGWLDAVFMNLEPTVDLARRSIEEYDLHLIYTGLFFSLSVFAGFDPGPRVVKGVDGSRCAIDGQAMLFGLKVELDGRDANKFDLHSRVRYRSGSVGKADIRGNTPGILLVDGHPAAWENANPINGLSVYLTHVGK